MPDLTCDLDAALRFVEALTGSSATSIVVQSYDDDQTRKASILSRVIVGPLRETFSHLQALNRAGAAIAIQVNAGGRGARRVTRLRALFTDDDGKNPAVPLRLNPSIQVRSSAGERNIHNYFLLQDEDAERLSDFEAAQRQLATYYRTDAGVSNLDRVLRLPGFFNQKRDPSKGRDGTPFMVEMIYGDSERDYGLNALLRVHPVPVAPTTTTTTTEADTPLPTADEEGEKVSREARRTAERLRNWLEAVKGGLHRWPWHEGTVTRDDVRRDGLKFHLRRCPFNKDHLDTALIRVINPSGAIWAGCFHETAPCSGNRQRWTQFKHEIGSWSQQGKEPFVRADHPEIAQRLLKDLAAGTSEPIVSAEGHFWCYRDGVWQKIPEHQPGVVIAGYAGAPRGALSDKIVLIKKPDKTGAVSFAHDLSARPSFFVDAPAGLSFANGFLRFGDFGCELLQAHPDQRCRFALPFAYEPSATAPRWQSYLHWCFSEDADGEDKIALLQEFTGAMLVAEAWRYQTAFLLLGPGANGKSVYLDVITGILPKHLVAAVKPQRFDQPYSLAALVGVRLNAVQEIPQADILAADSFKEIVDGKVIQARRPYEHEFSFAPRLALVMSANRLPGTVDYTHAFFRRFRVVEFNRTMAETDADPRLPATLLASEAPGIVAWALDGANRLRLQDGYSNPPSSAAALLDWRQGADAVAIFRAECTTDDHGVGTATNDLFACFRQWCELTYHRQMSRETFTARLQLLGVRSHRRTNKDRFLPLRLTDNAPTILLN